MIERKDIGILGLDILIATTGFITFAHAAISGGKQVALCIAILAVATLVEQLSIQLGHTHCHADSPLLMVSKCSSVNSIVFYLPWLYTSVFMADRMRQASNRKGFIAHVLTAFKVGQLQLLFGIAYESLGPSMNWWK
jgi:hypothetical protein